jgi:putative lipoprotein
MGSMRSVLALIAAGLLFAGVVRAQQTQAPGASPAEGQGYNNNRPAIHWKQFEYTCEGGSKISVYTGGSLAKLLYEGHQYVLKQKESSDGELYSDGKFRWTNKGDVGSLQEEAPDGKGRMLVQGCHADKPVEEPIGVVTGTVVYPHAMSLPANTLIDVKLQDVSQANLDPRTVAEQKITMGDRHLPVLFELKFDPSRIDATHSYLLSANVLVDEEIRLTNEKTYPVLTLGNSSHVEVVLRKVEEAAQKKQPWWKRVLQRHSSGQPS